MLPIDYTRAFKRDFKKQATLALSRHWIEALYCLCQRQSLPARYRDHALGGDWQGFRDCHIEPDLVLIYRQTEQALELVPPLRTSGGLANGSAAPVSVVATGHPPARV